MADQNFEYFLTKFPISMRGKASTAEHERAYAGLVPDALISYWREFGFSGFGDGLVWLVDPIDWQAISGILVDGVRHPQLAVGAQYIPIVRSAFGKVWFWTPDYGVSLTLDPVLGTAFYWNKSPVVPTDFDRSVGAFFVGSQREEFDVDDDDDVGLFERVRERVGPLQADEVYGFVPAILYGGAPVADNVSIFPVIPHLVILREAIGSEWTILRGR